MSADTPPTTPTRKPVRPAMSLVLKSLLKVTAMVCLTAMAIEQVQLYRALSKEAQNLATYREHLEPVSKWASKTGTASIGYLQTAPTRQADGAKKVMTQYLVAPLILKQPERGVLLVNFSNQAHQEAFEKSQNCHVVHQFRPGLALMEKNP